MRTASSSPDLGEAEDAWAGREDDVTTPAHLLAAEAERLAGRLH